MRLVVATLLCAAALPLVAQEEMEQILLPVGPSVMVCSRNSRYETRLVIYNQNKQAVRLRCGDDACGSVAPAEGRDIAGSDGATASLPTFLFVPKSEADGLRMSLVVESGDVRYPMERSFAELPIVRASDFRDTKMTFVGVRMDPDFRQALRIFGLDGTQAGEVMVRAYDLATEEMIYEEPHWLWPQSDERTETGMAVRPSFSIECDLSAELPNLLNGQHVRIELEPLTPGLKYWSFVSLTNNKTQHFYTITPR